MDGPWLVHGIPNWMPMKPPMKYGCTYATYFYLFMERPKHAA